MDNPVGGVCVPESIVTRNQQSSSSELVIPQDLADKDEPPFLADISDEEEREKVRMILKFDMSIEDRLNRIKKVDVKYSIYEKCEVWLNEKENSTEFIPQLPENVQGLAIDFEKAEDVKGLEQLVKQYGNIKAKEAFGRWKLKNGIVEEKEREDPVKDEPTNELKRSSKTGKKYLPKEEEEQPTGKRSGKSKTHKKLVKEADSAKTDRGKLGNKGDKSSRKEEHCSIGKHLQSTLSDKDEDEEEEAFEDAVQDFQPQLDMFPNMPDEMNVVILGGTGNGKSTFINAVANLLTRQTLEDACRSPNVLIKTSFHHFDSNGFEKLIEHEPTISIESQGDGEDEDNRTGQSATQSPKSYIFEFGSTGNKKILRLIDTPGVGDVRGIDQDKLNFSKIVNFISSFKKIHAFLFLLKPNEARLSIGFTYGMNELLRHLHASAANNIVFCMSNGKGVSYNPQETYPTLKKYLNKIYDEKKIRIQLDGRYFVFNSIHFRYAAASRYNIKYSQNEIRGFQESWNFGREKLSNMISMICDFEPHYMKDTLSTTMIRKAIEFITQSSAEIAKNQREIMDIIKKRKESCEKLIEHEPTIPIERQGDGDEQSKELKRLNGEAKTVGQPENKGDSPWEKINAHNHSLSIPVEPERIQQPENLNDIIPGPEEISTSKTEAAGREPHLKDSLTIVFMGMSGSGKTTMVNGIANSFRYETFDKALKSGPRVVVPTRFTTFVGSKARIVQPALTINSQSQKNKNLNDGSESVTKDPIIHQFSLNTVAGKIPVRIVDTPGLNDTEGYDRDNTNLDKTFTFLEKLDKIDLICIVLKANESCLNFSLDSALKKLLRRLQCFNDKNISFVFTNGKTPGRSLALLREYFKDAALNIDKKKWLAFDNEPYRYLCTVRQYPEAANGERKEECQELFDHNVKELKRLLQRAQCLPSFKMPPGPVERKEAAFGQVMACNASTPDKIGSGTSLISKTLWRTEQGPSTSGSMKQGRSLTRVAVPVKAVPMHDAQKQADKEEDLKLKEKIEHDRTCRIVEALTEPLALQIFDNCKQILVLSDRIDQIQKDINRLNKENIICRSCNGQRCNGYFDVLNMCYGCSHHMDQHVNLCQNLDKLEEADTSFAMKVSARDELEQEDNVLRSACHHFSFFLTTEHQYPFFTNFEKMMNQLEMGLDESQKNWLSPSIQSFLTVFRRNIENDEQGQTYGEFVTVENTKKKLVELKQLKIFGPRAAQIINLYHPVPIF